MPTVRTSCPTCDTVLIDASSLTLRRRPGADRTEASFTCPDCVQEVIQSVSDKMVPVLIGAGCQLDEWSVDDARGLHPSAGQITEDEIRDFVSSLDADDWFEDLIT